MEWMGEAHNDGVRYVLGKLKIDRKKKVDQATIKKLATEYFGAVGITCKRAAFRFQRHPDTGEIVKLMQKKGIVTNEGAKVISALLTTIQKKLPLSKLLVEIERQEHTAASKLHDRELLFFQGIAAVARHSAKLWASVSEGGEDFGHVGTHGMAMKPINWGEVCYADVAGFLLGGPIGAVGFSVLDIIVQLLE